MRYLLMFSLAVALRLNQPVRGNRGDRGIKDAVVGDPRPVDGSFVRQIFADQQLLCALRAAESDCLGADNQLRSHSRQIAAQKKQ